MKKWIDTLKRITKALPLMVKIVFILAMVLEFVVFLIGEATLLYFIGFEVGVVLLYLGYVSVFHICRILNEDSVLEYIKLMGGTSKNG